MPQLSAPAPEAAEPQPWRLQGSAGRSCAWQGPVLVTARLKDLQRSQSVLPIVGWLLHLLRWGKRWRQMVSYPTLTVASLLLRRIVE